MGSLQEPLGFHTHLYFCLPLSLSPLPPTLSHGLEMYTAYRSICILYSLFYSTFYCTLLCGSSEQQACSLFFFPAEAGVSLSHRCLLQFLSLLLCHLSRSVQREKHNDRVEPKHPPPLLSFLSVSEQR